jgi:DNA-binding response OmpR family regulator
VCDRLREEGYRVLEAHSHDAATAILTSLPVHLLLLDASLEAGEGRPSLVRCAAGLRPPTVVIVTGTREMLSRLRDLAGATTVERPCALQDLVAVIRNRLEPMA